MLAYELIPLETSEMSEDGSEEIFDNAYLVTFTPADDVTKQYVKPWSCFLVFVGIPALVVGGIFALLHFL